MNNEEIKKSWNNLKVPTERYCENCKYGNSEYYSVCIECVGLKKWKWNGDKQTWKEYIKETMERLF